MAGALVGGAFLSAFLQVAFDRLTPREVPEFLKGRKDIDGSLKKLKMLLMSADMVLADAEDNQYTNPYVKEWLDNLQDAVYDADDLLDEIALRAKLQAESQTGTNATNTLPVGGWGLLRIKHTADFGNGSGHEDLKSLPEDMSLLLYFLFLTTNSS